MGQRYAGYRLQPGARVNAAELLKAIEGLEVDDTPGALERLDEATNMDDGVWEALQALASERDLLGTQRQLGVSERSLQRLIGAATGRPPLYWKRLARLRQAARALGGCEPLAHVAADQAHMNLEFQRWLGFTPARSGAAANLAARPAERGRVRVKSTLA